MKKTVLFASTLLVAGALSAQSIPDGTFESWNTETWMNPQFFGTGNGPNNGNANNTTQTPGYHGKYGVQMQTVSTNEGIQPAYLVNFNTNGKGFSGGIPYNQKPTGIRFYYQYTPTGADTAAVLVIFSLKGVQIDSFFIVLPHKVTSYTLYSYYPKNPLPSTPDTIGFVAVSSIAGVRNGGGNIGSTLIIDSVTFTGVPNQPAMMNGDFENWNYDTLLYPPGWYENSYPGVYRTTDAYAGKYAVEMVTTDSLNSGLQAGQISTGYYPNCNGNCHQLGGYPYSKQIDTLEFYYKYAPMGPGGHDTAQVNVAFVKDTPFYYTQMNLYAASSYTLAKLPFNTGSTIPDSVIISFQSTWHSCNGGGSGCGAPLPSNVGSTLKVDNLTFASQKQFLGINTVGASEGFTIYPNPARQQITLQFASGISELSGLEITDITGREVINRNHVLPARGIVTVNTETLASGIYFVKVYSPSGTLKVGKFVKE